MAKGPSPNHTACHPGKQVIITLRTGERIIDVFVERKKGDIFLRNTGKVKKKDMKSFAVYRKIVMHTP